MRKTLFIYFPQINAEPAGWLLRDGDGANNGQVETQQAGWPPEHVAKNCRVVGILGGEHCLLVPAQFPGRKNLNAWRKTAPWILEDQLAEDSAELHYAISNDADPQQTNKHWVAASQLAPLQQLIERCESHHLPLDHLSPDTSLLPAATDNDIVWAQMGARSLVRDQSSASALASQTVASLYPNAECWLNADTALAALDALSSEWHSNSLNLRQGTLAPGEAMVARLRPWKGAAIAAAITAIIWTGVTALQVQQLEAQSQSLKQEIASVFKSALPGARMVKPQAQMKQALAGSAGADNNSLLLTLQAATQPLAKIGDANLTGLDHRGNTLVINISATKIATVEQIREAMAGISDYQAEVGSVRADPDNVQLRVTVKPKTS